jgi:GDP-L-fucose synthase
MDVSRLKAMGWSPTISLEDGIKETIQWFEANYN